MSNNRTRENRKNEKGQTLLEMIIVIAISVIIIGALVFAIISSLRNAQLAKNQSQATKLAQEGIERVRSSRDRNYPFTALSGRFQIGTEIIDSWQDPHLWDRMINTNCGNTYLNPPQYCYFNLNNGGGLTYIGAGDKIPSTAEDPFNDGKFQRVVVIYDEFDAAKFLTQKTVTVIVSWQDFSGRHESRLTTLLRKI